MQEIELMPGNEGRDCPGNGTVPSIECQCDECDYLMCCTPEYNIGGCEACDFRDCPRRQNKNRKDFP